MTSRQRDNLHSKSASTAMRIARRFDLKRLWRDRSRRQWQETLEHRNWYDRNARSDHPAIFIGGCGRSGTTLFKELLNGHPNLFCGPESSLFGLPFDPCNLVGLWDMPEDELNALIERSPNLVAFADSFYSHFMARQGKRRWADKTPNNVRVVDQLLTCFPNGRFIHVIRDGRDVACSLRHHPKERLINGRIVPVRNTNPIDKCSRRWVDDVSSGLAYRSHPRYCEVRYESLVADPRTEMQRVCEFIGETFCESMITPEARVNGDQSHLLNNAKAREPISQASVGRWRRDLTADEQRVFDGIAGELLIALDYVRDHSWVATR